MNPLKVVSGFLPFFVFSLLASRIGAGWAGVAGLAAAVVVIAATARGGVKVVPAVQAVLLLVIALLGFVGNGPLDVGLVKYGPAVATLLLALFMIETAARHPFTAQFARSEVPPQFWHSKPFLEVNRDVSTVWGLAVLVLGFCQVFGALLSVEGLPLVVLLAVDWVLPIFAFKQAAAYTKRTIAGAQHRIQERKPA